MGKRGPTPQHERIRALPGREERRPPPPDDLTDAQRIMWRSIVETEPAHMFDSEARKHLLRLYCEHATFRASLQKLIDRSPVECFGAPEALKAFEAMLRARDRETKQIVSLATRMRITNQSRYTPTAASSAGRNHTNLPKPWDTHNIEPEDNA